MRTYLYGICATSWRDFTCGGIKVPKVDFSVTDFRVRCFSSRQPRRQPLSKVDHQQSIEEERDAFYVVRKGDIVGIYKSLSDCQAQVGSTENLNILVVLLAERLVSKLKISILIHHYWSLKDTVLDSKMNEVHFESHVCGPSVSVYKGYNLCKETEEYLASRGLKDPLYIVNAADVKEDLFGDIVPCPFQQPGVTLHENASKKVASLKRSNDMEAVSSGSSIVEQSKKLASAGGTKSLSRKKMSCILEFDGASKGNPGKAGAGAILRYDDGNVICRLRQGLGVATNNAAEYRALSLGLKHALEKGFTQVHAQGDSKLVCMQLNNRWKTKNENMANFCKEVNGLKKLFQSFRIKHVLREFNSEADAQANLAIDLPIGEVAEDSG